MADDGGGIAESAIQVTLDHPATLSICIPFGKLTVPQHLASSLLKTVQHTRSRHSGLNATKPDCVNFAFHYGHGGIVINLDTQQQSGQRNSLNWARPDFVVMQG